MAHRFLFAPRVFNILLFSITIAHAGSPRSLAVNFSREFAEYDSKEEATGTIYYLPPHKLTVVVEEPIDQWMIFDRQKLEIYYPDERKALRFTSSQPFQLSFFQAFLGVLDEDYGLGDIGYILVHRSKNGDTVATTWKPPKKLAKVLGDFTLVHEGQRIIRAESRRADGTVSSRCLFTDHYPYGNTYFPLTIITKRFFETDTSVERISFANPRFDLELPQDTIYFSLPDDVTIEESEW